MNIVNLLPFNLIYPVNDEFELMFTKNEHDIVKDIEVVIGGEINVAGASIPIHKERCIVRDVPKKDDAFYLLDKNLLEYISTFISDIDGKTIRVNAFFNRTDIILVEYEDIPESDDKLVKRFIFPQKELYIE